jgi:hypothetical protein
MGDAVDENVLWRRQQKKISAQKTRDKNKLAEIAKDRLLEELLADNKVQSAAKLAAERLAADSAASAAKHATDKCLLAEEIAALKQAQVRIHNPEEIALHSQALCGCRRK